MTDALDAVEKRAHEACPCRRRYKCGGYSDHVCSGSYEIPCRCEEPDTESARPCESAIHAAIRDLRREALKAGLERAARACESFGRAHTYASENADHYRGFDAGTQSCAERIRALRVSPDAD